MQLIIKSISARRGNSHYDLQLEDEPRRRLAIAHWFAFAVDLMSVDLSRWQRTQLWRGAKALYGRPIWKYLCGGEESGSVAQGASSHRLINKEFFSEQRIKGTRRGSSCKVL